MAGGSLEHQRLEFKGGEDRFDNRKLYKIIAWRWPMKAAGICCSASKISPRKVIGYGGSMIRI